MEEDQRLLLLDIVIVLCLFYLSAHFLAPHHPKSGEPEQKSISKISIKKKTAPKEIQTVEVKKIEAKKSEPKDLEINNAAEITACWDKLAKDAEARCHKYECLTQNLEHNQSWVALWIEDGWGDPQSSLSPNQRTKMGKAQYALAQAGLLNGRELPTDNESALNSLYELSQEDPQNSYPLVAIAEILRRQGDLASSEMYLARAAQTGMNFNSYYPELVHDLVTFNRNDPSSALMAMSLRSTVPMADYQIVQHLTEAFPQYAEALSFQMVQDGLNNNLAGDMNWVPIEYAIGRNLYNKATKTDVLPPTKDLFTAAFKDSPGFSATTQCQDQVNDWMDFLSAL